MSRNTTWTYKAWDTESLAGDEFDEIVTGKLTIQQQNQVAYQIDYSGNPTGSWAIEGTNVRDAGGTWIDIGMTIPNTTASDGVSPLLLNLSDLSFSYLRLKYTVGSGSGSSDVWASAKGV